MVAEPAFVPGLVQGGNGMGDTTIENVDETEDCPDCEGTGYITCEFCDGSGKVSAEDKQAVLDYEARVRGGSGNA